MTKRYNSFTREELDKSQDAGHVFGGKTAMPTYTRASTPVAREPGNDAIVDLSRADPDPIQPLAEMAGTV